MKEIQKKLMVIQQELRAPKNQRNEFNNFNYRSAEDILEAVKPILASQGLTLVLSDQMEYIGQRYYIKATATLSDGEDSITATAYAREDESRAGMSESQVTGCSSSYARKYCLNGLFCIDDGKDSDSFNNKKPQNKPISAPQNPEWTPTPQQSYNPANEPQMEAQPENPVYLGLKEFCRQAKPYEDNNELKKFFNFWAKKTGNWRGQMNYQQLWDSWKTKIQNPKRYA